MGEVTVITSGKGGVGKSTLTAGLGAALARRGRRVLLIDGDAGLRSLDLLLGVSQELVFDLSDIIAGNCALPQAVYPCPGLAGVSLLPAPRDGEEVVSPAIMRQLAGVLGGLYDHVLIDCPAGLGRGFRAAVEPAERALLVATPDPVCIRDCDHVRALLGERTLRLIINRFDEKSFHRYSPFADLDEVIDAAGVRLAAVVPEDPAWASAAARGAQAKGRSPAVRALDRLAARLEGETVPLVL